jgi:hypothetical protein
VAEFDAHVAQARHNEECAKAIMETNANARDWAITAAFYAAVHLAEACFATRSDIGHTESAQDRAGQEMHRYRRTKIFRIAPNAYRSYDKLLTASQNVRYLLNNVRGAGPPSLRYYDEAAARKMLDDILPDFRKELVSAFKAPLS